MTRRIKRILALLFLFLMVAVATVVYIAWYAVNDPYRAYGEQKILVSIPPGMSLDSATKTLAQRGVVRHPLLLKGIFYYQQTQSQLKAGEYVFDRPMTPLEVYGKLLRGEQQYRVLTIPEGTSTFDLGAIFEKEGFPKADFEKALKSPAVDAELNTIEPSLKSTEGFLFPETYYLSKKDNAEKVVLIMLQEFKKRFRPEFNKRAAELGMNVVQVVTLASLIEKETGQESERPLIGGVFHNRLKKGMLLQCDPTVIYALRINNQYKGTITYADLKKESPYNTYVSPGLPPGPIANPGEESIRAALYPETTDKLYFVSKNDGTHHFSATLPEHNRAVQQYQRR
jgi:UPF0755 protein